MSETKIDSKNESGWVMPETNIRHLTDRGYYSAIILAGLCANPNRDNTFADDADAAVKQADALIERLSKAR